ncbi:MAG: pilus assembly protein PilM [Clostridia bacterium]|nr:pilus assembly protein PilM [Clostridia bacterium]
MKKAVVIINDSLVVTRDRELPAAKPKELEQMVKLDASEFLPYDINEYTIRYKVLLASKQNPRNTNYILMSSIKNELLMDFCESLKAAGVKPIAIDTTINGMIKYMKRCIAGNRTESEKAIALIDFGAISAKMVIFYTGIPVYQQVMNHSSQKIDIMISTGLNLERDEAEEYKIRYGLEFLKNKTADDMSRAVGSIINSQIDLILADLYKHFQNFMSKSGGKAVDTILLTGGTAGMKGLDIYIQEAFNIPCRAVSAEDTVKFSNNKTIGYGSQGSIVSDRYPLFTNIAGAACRGE